MPRSLRWTRQEHSEALTPREAAGVPETWGTEDAAERLARGALRPRRPGQRGPGYLRVKGAAGGIPAPQAPPPRRQQQQEVGEVRLPSELTMDSSRAGLCPGRPPSRPGLRDRAGCSSRRAGDGQTRCTNRGLCRRDGGQLALAGRSDTATAGVWSSRDWAEEENVGPEEAPGAELRNPGSWALDEAQGGSTPGILGFGWGL